MRYDNKYVDQKALPDLIRQEEFNHVLDRKLSIRTFKNAVVVPRHWDGTAGAMYGNDGELVSESNIYDKPASKYDGDAEYCDYDVLFLGAIFSTWGHCITDFLGRLWPLLSCEHCALRVVFVRTNSSGRMPDNYYALLKALGVEKERAFEVQVPTRFKSVTFPDPSFFFCLPQRLRGCTKEYTNTVNAICSYYAGKAPPVVGEAIYLSRSKWSGGRSDFGEENIERVFRQCLGCRVLHPESMTFTDMFSVLWNCKLLVATDGSIGHNSLFVKPGTKVVFIRKIAHANGFQPVVSQIKELDVTYVDAHWSCLLANPKEPWFGPFFLLVNKRLAEFLQCKPRYLEAVLPFLRCFLVYVPRRLRVIVSDIKRRIVGVGVRGN